MLFVFTECAKNSINQFFIIIYDKMFYNARLHNNRISKVPYLNSKIDRIKQTNQGYVVENVNDALILLKAMSVSMYGRTTPKLEYYVFLQGSKCRISIQKLLNQLAPMVSLPGSLDNKYNLVAIYS